MKRFSLLVAAATLCASTPMMAEDDPYLWLEEVDSERALNWVTEQNQRSTSELESDPRFQPMFERFLAILDSDERIPGISLIGGYYYNFWRDADQPRGVWRRTTMDEYRKDSPKWEVVLDIDKLAADEEENWVWAGSNCLWPDYKHCLISLSRGGADANVSREFDLVEQRFVEDGFLMPESKGSASWRDANTLYVSRDFGEGSLTRSGYARQVREWKRGTPLDEAPVIFEGIVDDIAVGAFVLRDKERTVELIRRGTTFFTGEYHLRQGDEWVQVDLPDDVMPQSFQQGRMLLELRSDWTLGETTYSAGSLVALMVDDWMEGKRELETLFTPTARTSLAGVTTTRDHILINVLDNVRNRLYLLTPGDEGWTREPIVAPGFGTVGARALDSRESNDYLLTVTDFVTPSSLYLGNSEREGHELLKSLPAFFNAEGLQIEQFDATSADGTRIPYFQVSRKDIELDGSNPTVLGAYGGFQVSRLPSYSATIGAGWLERGGVYVLANIRGGGEFGPQWHQAALKENRQRAFDDMIAVAEALIERKVTSPEHLGSIGGSNGGLLMGVMQTQRPDLFGALVNQVPLLDMRRYHLLLAGASWVGEYGNPDNPDEWEYISKYSPYQNLDTDAEYPRVLLTTSTRDDRVHPGHARKFAARMAEQEHDFLYWENVEGGHGGAANNRQAAYMSALAYTFFARELGLNPEPELERAEADDSEDKEG